MKDQKPKPDERRSIWRVGPESTWTTVVPVVFIIASLVSLVILPLVESRKTAGMRVEISRVAEPASRAANHIQIDLSRELDKIIAFQVTGQDHYRADYFALVRREEANREALARLLPSLDEELGADLSALFAQTSRWHSAVARGEFVLRQMPNEIFLARLFEAHAAYEKSLIAASDLEVELQTAIESRLDRIREAEVVNLWMTIVLTLLALTSALLVAGLGRQMRLLAREAMRRRADAEREANEARQAREAAEIEERRAAFIAAAGQELVTTLDFDQTIAKLARLMVPNLAEMCVIDVVEADGSLRRAAVSHRNPAEETRYAREVGRVRHEIPEALTRIMGTQEPALIGSSSPLFEFMTGTSEGGSSTLVCLPLVSRGQTIGIASALSAEQKPFTARDLTLFVELARRASLAMDNARLYDESQQAVRAREEVLAIVSHDLRNPLNAVMLAASLLRDSASSAGDREEVETIVVSARRMNRLIADLLDVTRLEGGKRLPIDPAPVEVADLIVETEELFRAQAAAASVSLECAVEAGLPPVNADRHRILQVLSNLIGNSLKFTPAGGRVALSVAGSGDEVSFVISDTGPGIPQENLGDIFSPYWQAKRTERMGAGLGLPIAKGIVEAHGGRIWAESDRAGGSRFHFTLPAVGVRTTAESAGRR